VTFDFERKYANEHTELPARLFLSQGSLEKDDSQDHVQNLQEFVQILQKEITGVLNGPPTFMKVKII
jgi:hypothetical protein